MAQVARTLTDSAGGFLRNKRTLILDRDTKFTAAFKRVVDASGTRVIVTPYRAPNCNAYAERFVLSIKSECTDKMIFFGEAMLRRAINEYIEHYNTERPHQGIGNVVINGTEQTESRGEVVCHERLGGLLKHYRRAA